jgi:metal transporter CNNM
MILILAILVTVSGFFAGLILSFMGLDISDLERKAKLGDKRATKILPLRRKSNQLLSTLMMCNVFINSTISTFMSEGGNGGITSIIISASLILVFGDIVPTAICNKYKMSIASYTTPLVYVMFYILWPITYPLSYVLDRWLHVEMTTMFTKNEIKEIIHAHEKHSTIDTHEKNIMIGGLTYSSKSVLDIMTPITQLYRINIDKPVTLEELKKQNYARVPVYQGTRDNVIGILFLKDLVGESSVQIDVAKKYRQDGIIKVMETEKLDVLLNKLIKQQVHMSFVYDQYGTLRGVVTMEDILETIIDREILDESDLIVDHQEEAKRTFDIEKTSELEKIS